MSEKSYFEGHPTTYHVGDKVSKVGGDYTFDGTVVSVFLKISGQIRYVVEDDRGVLHVYSEKILKLTPEKVKLSSLEKLKAFWYKILE